MRSSLTFNSLSRDHGSGESREFFYPPKDFQLPLSGSQSALGCAIRPRRLVRFQLPLSGSLGGAFAYEYLYMKRFQLPLSGSRDPQDSTPCRSPRKTFNSLSRDHNIREGKGSVNAPGGFQLPLSGSLTELKIAISTMNDSQTFNSLSRDHLQLFDIASPILTMFFQLPLSGSRNVLVVHVDIHDL